MSTTRTLHKNNYCAKNRTKRYMVIDNYYSGKTLKDYLHSNVGFFNFNINGAITVITISSYL